MMGKRDKGNIIGKCQMFIGFIICWVIGFSIMKIFYIKLLMVVILSIFVFLRIKSYKRTSNSDSLDGNSK